MENRIRDLRIRRGLTQEELGEIVGASKRTISGIERGETKVTLEMTCKIADALGASLDEIAGRQSTDGSCDALHDVVRDAKRYPSDKVLGMVISRYNDMTDEGRAMLSDQASMIATVMRAKRKRKLKSPAVIVVDDESAIICSEDNKN